MQRLYGAALSVLLIGLSIWPACRTPSTDSFPFSNYPMFARKKGHPLVHRIVGITAKGERLRVPPEMIANVPQDLKSSIFSGSGMRPWALQ